MAAKSDEDRVVAMIIDAHGPVIDLQQNPDLFIEIVRRYGFDIIDVEPGTPDGGGGGGGPKGNVFSPDGGLPPGGVGPVGPTSFQRGPELGDIMKEVLDLKRQVAKLATKLDA